MWGHSRMGKVPQCWVHGCSFWGTGTPGVLPALHSVPGVTPGMTASPGTQNGLGSLSWFKGDSWQLQVPGRCSIP